MTPRTDDVNRHIHCGLTKKMGGFMVEDLGYKLLTYCRGKKRTKDLVIPTNVKMSSSCSPVIQSMGSHAEERKMKTFMLIRRNMILLTIDVSSCIGILHHPAVDLHRARLRSRFSRCNVMLMKWIDILGSM